MLRTAPPLPRRLRGSLLGPGATPGDRTKPTQAHAAGVDSRVPRAVRASWGISAGRQQAGHHTGSHHAPSTCDLLPTSRARPGFEQGRVLMAEQELLSGDTARWKGRASV